MPTPVIMPKFEMTQETGKVIAWLKNEGEYVEKGDPLLEVETDKVNQEVEAPASGIVAGISAVPGEVVPIATPIAYILKAGETLAAKNVQGAAGQASATVPGGSKELLGVSHVSPAGRLVTPLAARLAEENGLDLSTVRGTGPLGRITREDVESALQARAPVEVDFVWEGKVRAVPAARRLARELGIDLRTVRGSGPAGRIQPEDVRTATPTTVSSVPEAASAPTFVKETAPAAQAPSAEPLSPEPPATQQAPIAVRRVVPLTNIRRTIAERMTASVREAPQFTVTVDVDMGRALAIVDDLKAAASVDAKAKVTVTAVIVRACAWALREHPEANASYSDEGLVEWDEVNVGVATAVEQGLIVPVVRNADQLGLRKIAATMANLTGRAREGKLKLEDLQGGTFTVSNLGMFGIARFTAILNPPQAAILAVGRVARRAEVVAGPDGEKIEIRSMASLALTADHRVLDGATAAKFLASVQNVLEHPGLLLE